MQQLSRIQDKVQQQALNADSLFFYVDNAPAVDYIKTSVTTIKLFTDDFVLGEELSLEEVLQYIELEGMEGDIMIYGTDFEIADNKIILK